MERPARPQGSQHSASRIPGWLALGLVGVLLLASIASIAAQTIALNGRLIYALDDAYIHMAMAKNLSQHGVWGVTRYEFAGASSSPLYTATLGALYLVFGVNDWTPLVMNAVAALALLVVASRILGRYGYPPLASAVVAIAILFLMPVTTLVFSGMEHVFHALLTLGFVAAASVALSDAPADRTGWWRICLLGALAVAVRYESLAAVGAVVVLTAALAGWKKAATLAASAVIAPLAYGAISVALGSYFLPNSLVMKVKPSYVESLASAIGTGRFTPGSATSLLVPGFSTLWSRDGTHLVLPLFTLAVLVVSRLDSESFRRPERLFGVIALVAGLAHVVFGNVGWFYRYEAYVVALTYMAIMLLLAKPLLETIGGLRELDRFGWIRLAAAAVVALMLLAPSVDRALKAGSELLQATNNIYSQQYQMARYVSAGSRGRSVALNDIGAVNYYADIRCLDLAGLGSRDVTAARRRGGTGWNRAVLEKLSDEHDVEVAMIYDSQHRAVVPTWWQPVGSWTIERNVVCGSDTVNHYESTGDEQRGQEVAAELSAFSSGLPPSAHWRPATTD